MRLRHLHYFVKIVEAGSISRAAAIIRVAQPALSQRIADLEAELGVSLLHRSARGVRPTAAGQVLYREASAILRQVERLPGIVRSSGGEIEGAVSLGMSSTLAASLAGPLMETCGAVLPRISLRFVTADNLSVKARLEAKTLDIGVVFEDEPIPGFVRRPLFRQRLYLIRRRPPADSSDWLSFGELAALPLILPADPNVTRSLLDRLFAAAGVVPNIVAQTDVLSSTLAAVETGMGGAIIPKGDFSDVPGHDTLQALRIEPPIYLTASLVTLGDTPLTRAGEAVRDLLVSLVERHLLSTLPPGAERLGGQASISAATTPIST